MKRRMLKQVFALLIAAIGMASVFIGLLANGYATANHGLVTPTALPQSSYLFRFDPTSQTFFSFILPNTSIPYGIAVTGTNPTLVWIAEYGRDRIGHLVFTDTNDTWYTEYPVTSTVNSGPYRLALDGNWVWLTERGANRVGRLDTTTGEFVEFYGHGLSPDSGLADIGVAPDGAIWTAGQTSNRLIQLIVTSTTDYAFNEYTHTLLSGPSGVAIAPGISPSYDVWFTAPSARRVGRFTPADGSFAITFLPLDSRPYEIAHMAGYMWFTDLGHNSIGQIELGTFPILNVFEPVSRPTGFAIESSRVMWMTQQNEQGGLARFVYTPTQASTFDYFDLPVSELRPTGIAVATDSGVWFAAFAPVRVYLPIVIKG